MEKIGSVIKFFAITVIIVATFSFVSKVGAQKPFGGSITFIRPCIGGHLITLGPPNPGEYFSGPGTRSYIFGPPKRVGQWLLGMSTASVSCYLGPVYYGQGSFIMFHGSSI